MRILISLLLPSICLIGIFLLGRFFIRRPEAPTNFFTFGTNPQAKFGLWWFRMVGYLFCITSAGLAVLTAIYLAILTLQKR